MSDRDFETGFIRPSVTLSALPEGSEAFVFARYFSDQIAREKPFTSAVFVYSNTEKARAALNLFKFLTPDLILIDLPARDANPFERAPCSPEIISRRMRAFRNLHTAITAQKPYLLVTTVHAAMQKIRPLTDMSETFMNLKPGSRIPPDKVSRFLTACGYLHTPTVRESGEYAIRGGIVDIFPVGKKNPLRLDYAGNEIEKIKTFDPVSQLSGETVKGLTLIPASEILLSAKAIENFQKNYLTACAKSGKYHEGLCADVGRGVYVQGIERYLPFFQPDLTDPLTAAKGACLWVDRAAFHDAEEHEKEIEERRDERARTDTLPESRELYLSARQIQDITEENQAIFFTSHALPENSKIVDLGLRPSKKFIAERKTQGVNLFHSARDYMNEKRQTGKKIFYLCRSAGVTLRSSESFRDFGLKAAELTESLTGEAAADPAIIHFYTADLPYGFETRSTLYLTESDVFGEKTATRSKRKGGAEKFLREISSLSPGDYVTHEENGVGKFISLTVITVNNASHECVLLEYSGGDRLYLPVENLDLLTRYAGEDALVQLDRLGGVGWQQRKAKLKERINEMAAELVRTAAERALKSAPVLAAPHDEYEEFRARFPYDETPDQRAAIEASLEDLASGRPSDRLICGDVGFGKTEAAIRAAFVCAVSGYQTAIIVPTTLLARQHYMNFVRRFEGTGVTIGRLSRMVPLAEAKETRERLESGGVDIVIGTHALLSEKVKFKRLSLLIIDEEQHFGVKHKEQLKSFKSDLHVLTLTATPIPRTLQLSLGGARELSVIASPPADRLAVRTYIDRFDAETVRMALLREKNRGGQSFFVAPRISDLAEIRDYLRNVVPEVSFAVIHGQMKPQETDTIMNDFYDGKHDVLVATAIIESGIDIPTANTMIVWEADKFGLAQLYQIRGRIGRAKLRGYAYLTYPSEKKLTDNAEKRLKVLSALDGLGAGFTIASHDSDIRGAGNLLGDEQSGHIREVGYELYQEMLNEALQKLRAEGGTRRTEEEGNKSPAVNLGLSALIPQEYIPDSRTRFHLYQRLSELNDVREADLFAAELTDRFGKIPEATENLLKTVSVKNACKKAGVCKLDMNESGATLAFYKNHFTNPEGLLNYAARSEGKVTLRPDQKIALRFKVKDHTTAVKMVMKRLSEIAEIRNAKI